MLAQYLFNKNTIIAILVVSFVSFLYIRDINQRNKINSLSRTNEMLNLSIQQYQKTLDNVQKDIEKVKQSNKELISLNHKLSNEKVELEKILFRERQGKKPMSEVSIKAPEKVQYRINKATKEVFRCLEIITGDNYEKNENDLARKCVTIP
jgi:regulator of replication initiation timing